MEPCNDMNIDLTKKAKNNFEKYFFKFRIMLFLEKQWKM